MKKLIIPAIIIIGCTKNQKDFMPEVRSVTYLHHYYQKDFRYKSDTVIHWCRVEGQELKTFQAAVKMESYCDSDDSLELKIEKICK